MSDPTVEGKRFVWPPVSVPGESVIDAEGASVSSEPAVEVTEGFLALAERSLFDPTAEPIRRRAAQIGWSPDEPGQYCDRCGHAAGPYEVGEMGCSGCHVKRLKWRRVVRLGAYDDPLSRWIQEVKFTRWTRLGFDLGRWLGESIREQRVFAEAGEEGQPARENRGVIVVPMATSLRRRWSRGIDHAGVIARGVSVELRAPLVRALRRAHRPSQRRMAMTDRRRNVRGAFVCRAKKAVFGRDVVLVDDVMTTGATAHDAARALLKEGGAASVVLGVLGVAGEDS